MLLPSGAQTGPKMSFASCSPPPMIFRLLEPSALITSNSRLPFKYARVSASQSPFGDQVRCEAQALASKIPEFLPLAISITLMLTLSGLALVAARGVTYATSFPSRDNAGKFPFANLRGVVEFGAR